LVLRPGAYNKRSRRSAKAFIRLKRSGRFFEKKLRKKLLTIARVGWRSAVDEGQTGFGAKVVDAGLRRHDGIFERPRT